MAIQRNYVTVVQKPHFNSVSFKTHFYKKKENRYLGYADRNGKGGVADSSTYHDVHFDVLCDKDVLDSTSSPRAEKLSTSCS